MKTTFDVMDRLYKIVNVAAVKATLDGKVYRNARPIDSTTRDIVILALHVTSGVDIDVQQGIMIVNCFAPDIEPGIPDDANLNAMTSAVVTVLESYAASSEYFQIEINSQTVMDDIDQAGMSYSSLRVNFVIQFV